MRIKMTAKRQATFPRKLCEEMRLEPGQSIQVEPATIDGQRVWVLAPQADPPPFAWVGMLRRYAKAKPPSMTEARARIMEAMSRGDDLD